MGHWQQVVESSLSKLVLLSLILSEFNDLKNTLIPSYLLFLEPNTPPKFQVFQERISFSSLHVPWYKTSCVAFSFLVSKKNDVCDRFRMQGKNRFMPVHMPHPMNSVVRDDYYDSDNPRIVSWPGEFVRENQMQNC